MLFLLEMKCVYIVACEKEKAVLNYAAFIFSVFVGKELTQHRVLDTGFVWLDVF